MAFPTTPTASSIKIIGLSPTLTSVTHSLKRQARSRGSQRWSIELGYPAMTRTTFAPLWAFVNAQQGQYSTFTFIPPIYGDTSGIATGTLLVNNVSNYAAGDSSITCDGLTDQLKAGDFIKFTGHDKVYTVTADGSTTIEIEPPLMSAVADNEVVIYNDVPFTMALVDDKQELSMGIDQLVGYSVKLVEVV
jgi:hypothetical protein